MPENAQRTCQPTLSTCGFGLSHKLGNLYFPMSSKPRILSFCVWFSFLIGCILQPSKNLLINLYVLLNNINFFLLTYKTKQNKTKRNKTKQKQKIKSKRKVRLYKAYWHGRFDLFEFFIFLASLLQRGALI